MARRSASGPPPVPEGYEEVTVEGSAQLHLAKQHMLKMLDGRRVPTTGQTTVCGRITAAPIRFHRPAGKTRCQRCQKDAARDR